MRRSQIFIKIDLKLTPDTFSEIDNNRNDIGDAGDDDTSDNKTDDTDNGTIELGTGKITTAQTNNIPVLRHCDKNVDNGQHNATDVQAAKMERDHP